jgi:hypothetical protein
MLFTIHAPGERFFNEDAIVQRLRKVFGSVGELLAQGME